MLRLHAEVSLDVSLLLFSADSVPPGFTSLAASDDKCHFEWQHFLTSVGFLSLDLDKPSYLKLHAKAVTYKMSENINMATTQSLEFGVFRQIEAESIKDITRNCSSSDAKHT